MADFLEVAEALHRTGKTEDQAEHFERVIEARGKLQAVHSKSTLDISNIEEVFNALELAKIIGVFPDSDEDYITDAISSLRKVISFTLESTIKFPARDGKQIYPPSPYQEFAELIRYLLDDAVPRRTVSVITFNYDLAVDHALSFNGLSPNYSIEGCKDGRVPLLKLHGSTNWGRCATCQKVVCWSLEDYFSKFHFPLLSELNEVTLALSKRLDHLSHCDGPLELDPFLVPPTWNKADHHGAIGSVWRRAANAIAGVNL